MITFIITAVIMGAILRFLGFNVLKWFFNGWRNPWRYRIVEKNSGRSYPQWRIFWVPFWSSYSNSVGVAYYYNAKVHAEAFINEEIEKYLAKQTKAKHYYPQQPPPLPSTSVEIQ